MRVMDETPIDVPAIGKLVKEQYAVGQLADNCLYVLPSNTKVFIMEAKRVFDELIQSMGEAQLLNRYDFEVLEKMPVMDNHPTLSNAIKEEQCLLVMPLYTPSKTDKQYLLLRSEEWKLYNDMALMMYTSERITKHSVNELLKEFAWDTPETFCDSLKDAVKTEKFWKNYFTTLASDMFHPTFGIRPSLPNIRETLNIDGIINQQDKDYKCPCSMESHVSNSYARYITSIPFAFSKTGLENKLKLLVLNANHHELTLDEFYHLKYYKNEYNKIINDMKKITDININHLNNIDDYNTYPIDFIRSLDNQINYKLKNIIRTNTAKFIEN